MKQLINILTVIITVTAIAVLSSCSGISKKTSNENSVLTKIKKVLEITAEKRL